uniref:G_PROTEIN_RECEP_F1_2 domain-containing protein n=1 Tax=Macrostomum lignano TaxID=282301 RepID=A0A1I8F5S2_9PLAT
MKRQASHIKMPSKKRMRPTFSTLVQYLKSILERPGLAQAGAASAGAAAAAPPPRSSRPASLLPPLFDLGRRCRRSSQSSNLPPAPPCCKANAPPSTRTEYFARTKDFGETVFNSLTIAVSCLGLVLNILSLVVFVRPCLTSLAAGTASTCSWCFLSVCELDANESLLFAYSLYMPTESSGLTTLVYNLLTLFAPYLSFSRNCWVAITALLRCYVATRRTNVQPGVQRLQHHPAGSAAEFCCCHVMLSKSRNRDTVNMFWTLLSQTIPLVAIITSSSCWWCRCARTAWSPGHRLLRVQSVHQSAPASVAIRIFQVTYILSVTDSIVNVFIYFFNDQHFKKELCGEAKPKLPPSHTETARLIDSKQRGAAPATAELPDGGCDSARLHGSSPERLEKFTPGLQEMKSSASGKEVQRCSSNTKSDALDKSGNLAVHSSNCMDANTGVVLMCNRLKVRTASPTVKVDVFIYSTNGYTAVTEAAKRSSERHSGAQRGDPQPFRPDEGGAAWVGRLSKKTEWDRKQNIMIAKQHGFARHLPPAGSLCAGARSITELGDHGNRSCGPTRVCCQLAGSLDAAIKPKGCRKQKTEKSINGFEQMMPRRWQPDPGSLTMAAHRPALFTDPPLNTKLFEKPRN